VSRERRRSPWAPVPIEVSFESGAMEVTLRDGKRQVRKIVTPIFRLPDGTEFTGRRIGPPLRRKLESAARSRR